MKKNILLGLLAFALSASATPLPTAGGAEAVAA